MTIARRYLTRFDSRDLPQRYTDVLVIGSGVAGFSAALEAAERARVTVLTKAEIRDTNTQQAQGGIAAALSGDADERLHTKDTIAAGGGLVDREVARFVAREGPRAVRRFITTGASFDTDDAGELDLTREGGHSARRILHANGDATGAEVQRSLCERVARSPAVHVIEHAFCLDLLTSPRACIGALFHTAAGGLQIIWAKRTVLASGGVGRIFRETTNPPVATGDGLAMALRAGLPIEDLEFIQFHPTTLYVAGSQRWLISEAVRGEGAYLRDGAGTRFMPEVHPQAELAPRDVVAQAIQRRMDATGHPCVYLDLAHLDPAQVHARFPGISRLLRSFKLDMARDRIPVRPAAHYCVGGVPTNLRAETGIKYLYAAGEVACTRLHGANRLGSNSLLEGLVFGCIAGKLAGDGAKSGPAPRFYLALSSEGPEPERPPLDISDLENTLRARMSRSVGVERRGDELDAAVHDLRYWLGLALAHEFHQTRGWELQNQLTVALAIAQAALRRRESRGAHARADHPAPRATEARHRRLRLKQLLR